MILISIREAATILELPIAKVRKIIRKNNLPLIIKNNLQHISKESLETIQKIKNSKRFSKEELSEIFEVSRDRISLAIKRSKVPVYLEDIEQSFLSEEVSNRHIFIAEKDLKSLREELYLDCISFEDMLHETGLSSPSHLSRICRELDLEVKKKADSMHNLYTQEHLQAIKEFLEQKRALYTYKTLKEKFKDTITDIRAALTYLSIPPIYLGKRKFYTEEHLEALRNFYKEHAEDSKTFLAQQSCLKKYGVSNVFQREDVKKDLRQKQSRRREFEGRCFDSTWEIYVYFYFRENNIPFQTQIPLEYQDFYGTKHIYFCYFYREDTKEYIEIKNPEMLDENGNLKLLYDKNNPNATEKQKLLDAKSRCMKEHNVIIISDISFYQQYFKKHSHSKISVYKRSEI